MFFCRVEEIFSNFRNASDKINIKSKKMSYFNIFSIQIVFSLLLLNFLLIPPDRYMAPVGNLFHFFKSLENQSDICWINDIIEQNGRINQHTVMIDNFCNNENCYDRPDGGTYTSLFVIVIASQFVDDSSLKIKVLARLSRVENANFGDSKQLGDNLFELRFFFGSGFRIYYTIKEGRIVLLLVGGDKSSQQKDIDKAEVLLKQMED